MKNIYLDTETTGFKPGQIAELTMIIEDSSTSSLIGTKNYFFTVNSMDAGAQEAHGFSIEALKELSNGKEFKDYYEEIYDIIKDSALIAHNVKFDANFICTELWRCGIVYKPVQTNCSMQFFKDILRIPSKYPKYGPYKNPKLEEVLSNFGISTDKVNEYSQRLFNYSGSSYHDSRFDTTAMYIAINVYRERLHGGTAWQSYFCK